MNDLENIKPTYGPDDVEAINQRLRQYKENKELITEAEKAKKKEIEEVNNFYDYKINKAEKDNELLMAELLNFIDLEHGQTSVTTSMGNVQARTTKNKYNWGSKSDQEEAIKQLPAAMTKQVLILDKQMIKNNTLITDDGKVVIADTGEVIKGLSGIKGGKKQCVIRLDR